MDEKEKEFSRKLLQTFKIEAEEHLKALVDGLLEIETNQNEADQKKTIQKIFREAHSLKGASRAVNLEVIQNLCQSFENVLADLRDNKIKISKEIINLCYATIDLVTKLLPKLNDYTEADFEEVEKMANQLEGILGKKVEESEDNIDELDVIQETPPQQEVKEEPKPVQVKQEETKITPVKKEEPKPTQVKQEATKPSSVKKDEAKTSSVKAPEPSKQSAPEPVKAKQETPAAQAAQKQEAAQSTQKQAKTEKAEESFKVQSASTLRVSSHKLDALLQHIEEMLAIKQSLSQQLLTLKNLNTRISQFEKEKLNIKAIQEDVLSMKKISEQDNHFVGGLIDSLLDEAKKVLLQPISTILVGFPRMVRDISHSLGKEVQLEFHGTEIEIDRRILEEIKDPFIHLIRNAIDHGIETPNERVKCNKPEIGKISIAATQIQGSQVEIVVTDDGEGINLEGLKNAVVAQGYSREELDLMEEQDLLSLIFKTGVSTSEIITEFSGRGLGLGIVYEKIEQIGGNLTVESIPQIGTKFKIRLPVTMATFRGIYLRSGKSDFIMPTQNVQALTRMTKDKIYTVENKEVVKVNGQVFSFVYLDEILNIKNESKQENAIIPVLLIKASDHTIAFAVTEIYNELEVLVKGFGKQLLRVKNFLGATILEEGRLVPILNPFDLVRSAISLNTRRRKEVVPKTEIVQKRILLAEDSITTRILFKNILESSGYSVKTAVDGAEAYSILEVEQFDMLLSDIEMPNMDGFELTKKVRETDKIKDMPIVLITSRGSKEDREHGIEVGADAYLDKGGFKQSHFLEVIETLI